MVGRRRADVDLLAVDTECRREAISHLVLPTISDRSPHVRVRNPLPAIGGTDPEPIADVKLFAPTAFRKRLQRAIL